MLVCCLSREVACCSPNPSISYLLVSQLRQLMVLSPLVVFGLLDRIADPLIWLAIGFFLLGTLLELNRRQSLAVYAAGLGWGLFGLFWLAMFPYFYSDVQSPLQALLSLAGAPLSWYAGYLLVNGRTSLLALSRAIGFMGLIYLPMTMIEPARQWLIETVAVQTIWGMELLGYSPVLEEGGNGYQSRLSFDHVTGEQYATYIVLACTGIGSISIFAGLIAAVSAPLKQKLIGIAAATGVIWVLNLARNVFVGVASPLGWFDYGVFHSITELLAGEGQRTSYFISHHLISQPLSIVALLGITLLVVRIVPTVLNPLEEVLFVLTGNDYDLEDAFGEPLRTDGGER